MSGPTLRFAPSPNGRLHLGHAFSALLNARIAQAIGGRLLLRIEDIDPERCRPEHAAALRADLAWLGLAFAGPPLVQSERIPVHAAALEGLRVRGLAYPCFCSRRQVRRAAEVAGGGSAACDPDGAPLYPGTCRHLSSDVVAARLAAGAPHAWRLAGAEARATLGERANLVYTAFAPDAHGRIGAPTRVRVRPERWGDAVIGRKDVPTSYHLAVVVDDAAQGVTHVVRGRDLVAATDLHRLLQRLLGLPGPLYHHHALLTDPQGQKLAKSAGSTSLAELRAQGVTAFAARERLGFAWSQATG